MNPLDNIGHPAAESTPDTQIYIPQPVFYTSPIQLRAVAHLYGVETLPLDKARVLELGCGNGGNLLPFALAYPHGKAVGIDLWPEPIQQGNKQVHDLALKNLSLHAMPFTNVDKSIGEFDYIIVHDMFTWASASTREAILRICRNNLSDKGIAYIGTQTYPGWKAGDTLRDIMQMHSHDAGTLEEAVGSAIATLGLMSDGLAPQNSDAIALKALVERFRQHPDYYINAEFLQSEKSSFYFVEFADAAMQAGLAYVGDAEPQEELSATYGPNTQLNHSIIAMGQPKVMRQQYLDFAVGRQFHKSLFVRTERMGEIQATPDLSRLADLHWASKYSRIPADPALSRKKAHFADAYGNKLFLDDALAISMINALSSAWPLTLDFQALKTATLDALNSLSPDHNHLESVQQTLKTLFQAGTLRYALDQGPYDTSPDTCLNALPKLVRQHEREDAPIRLTGVSLWHDAISFDLDRKADSLLSNLDGGHTFAQLTEKLCKTLQDEQVQSKVDNKTVLPQAEQKVTQTIDFLRRQGALKGSSTAWASYLKAALLAHQGELLHALPYLSPLTTFCSKPEFGGLGIENRQPINHNHSRGTRVNTKSKTASPSTMQRISKLKAKELFQEIEPLARELTIQFPHDIYGWSELGMALVHIGNIPEGIKALLKALTLQPTNSIIHTNLGMALQMIGLDGPAISSLNKALRLNPKNATAWSYLGNAYRGQNKTWESALCQEHALSIDPKYFDAHNNLANVRTEQMRLGDAIKHYQRALDIRPDFFQTHSNLLFTLTHDESVDPTYMFEEHRRFGKAVEEAAKSCNPKPPVHLNSKDPERTLRVGFVSGDLRQHAVTNFLEPIWRTIDKSRYELYAYSTAPKEDAASTRLQAYLHKWVQATGMSDRKLAESIKNDKIDILFDLSGHTGYNRLPMFALKPAPVQVSWIGYPATTGLKAMDYYMVDKLLAPIGTLDEQFTEKLVRLPVVAAFDPDPNSPEINALPSLEEGKPFTFGSFNRLSKLSDSTLKLWAEVLQAIPESRMLLGNLMGEAMTQELIARFAKHDIDSHRLALHQRTTLRNYLPLHHQVDLLLDTFPYTGGTTTNHGLWMGIPTLTLAGNTLPGRVGAALMGNAGLDEFVVQTRDEYVSEAVRWSKNRHRLNELRQGMRKRIGQSPQRTEGSVVVRGLEAALRQMWQKWCEGQTPSGFEVEA